MLAALGIVFGDLGTSPLYTLQTVVQAMAANLPPARRSHPVAGVWTLIITISIKYCLFVMRADNRARANSRVMSLIGANDFKPATEFSRDGLLAPRSSTAMADHAGDLVLRAIEASMWQPIV